MNRIVKIETVEAESDAGIFPYIMIAVDVDDPNTVDGLVADVAEKTKLQRMCSPPETAHLLITVVGALTAGDFCTRWRKCVDADPALKWFMSTMRVAGVVQGSANGEMLSEASLLE